ncbi:MAG: tetratricopeptide repeat protein [Phycisphaerales bacterium]|nr:tetratricopeptide repeat protein [Phycisphaerales bacterium]
MNVTRRCCLMMVLTAWGWLSAVSAAERESNPMNNPGPMVAAQGQVMASLSSMSEADRLAAQYPTLGQAYRAIDEDRLDEAEKWLRSLVGHRDESLRNHAGLLLARLLVNQDRYEEALPMLDALVKLPPETAGNRAKLCSCWGVSGGIAGGEKHGPR